MGKILCGDELERFILEYRLDCNSIIITIDDSKHKAEYIIDGKKRIKANYDQIKKYFNKED